MNRADAALGSRVRGELLDEAPAIESPDLTVSESNPNLTGRRLAERRYLAGWTQTMCAGVPMERVGRAFPSGQHIVPGCEVSHPDVATRVLEQAGHIVARQTIAGRVQGVWQDRAKILNLWTRV